MNYNRIEEALCAGELDCIVDFQTLVEAVAEREKIAGMQMKKNNVSVNKGVTESPRL